MEIVYLNRRRPIFVVAQCRSALVHVSCAITGLMNVKQASPVKCTDATWFMLTQIEDINAAVLNK
jgi:hypothetical protein